MSEQNRMHVSGGKRPHPYPCQVCGGPVIDSDCYANHAGYTHRECADEGVRRGWRKADGFRQ